MESVKHFFKPFFDLRSFIKNFWYYEDNKIKELVLVALFIVSILSLLILSNDLPIFRILKYFFCYLLIFSSWFGLISLLTQFLGFGRRKDTCGCNKILYVLYFLVSYVISLPIIIFVLLIDSFVVRKEEDIIRFIQILALVLILYLFLFQHLDIPMKMLLRCLEGLLDYFEIKSDGTFPFIILIMVVTKVVIDFLTFIVLQIYRWAKIITIRRQTKISGQKARKIVTDKICLLSEISIEKVKDELEESIDYVKKTMWRFELACLIFLYVAVTVDNSFFPEMTPEIKDATTIITLWMLYRDKSREWVKRKIEVSQRRESEGKDENNIISIQ